MEDKNNIKGRSAGEIPSAPPEGDHGSSSPNCSHQEHIPLNNTLPHGHPSNQNSPYPTQVYTVPYPGSSMCYPPAPPPPYYLSTDIPSPGPFPGPPPQFRSLDIPSPGVPPPQFLSLDSHAPGASPPPYFYPGLMAHPHGFPSHDQIPRPPPYVHPPEPRTPPVTNPEVSQARPPPQRGLSTIDCHNRLKFLRKVYIFHLLQMVILNGILCLFFYLNSVRAYFMKHSLFTIVAIIAEFILVFLLAFSAKLRSSWTSYVTLFLCGTSLSFLVAISAASTDGRDILLTTTITIICTCVFLIFAGKKMAFVTWGGLVISVAPVIAGCFAYNNAYPFRFNRTVIAGVGALFISLYVNWDMVQMLRGTHKCFPPNSESVCLCSMLLQKLVFSVCFVMCFFFVFY